MRDFSMYPKGGRVIARLLYEDSILLTPEQSFALWEEMKAYWDAHYPEDENIEDIELVESSLDGRLDTYERGFVQETIGKVLTGRIWPSCGDGIDAVVSFNDCLLDRALGRGYALRVRKESIMGEIEND